LVRKELEAIKETSQTDCYVAGNPQLTQENILDLTARETMWAIAEEIFGGDFSYLEEEDESDSETEAEELEQVGY
jgi:hypothetical protein